MFSMRQDSFLSLYVALLPPPGKRQSNNEHSQGNENLQGSEVCNVWI